MRGKKAKQLRKQAVKIAHTTGATLETTYKRNYFTKSLSEGRTFEVYTAQMEGCARLMYKVLKRKYKRSQMGVV